MTDKFGKELEVGCFVGRTLSRADDSCGLYRVFGFYGKSTVYCIPHYRIFNDYKWYLSLLKDVPKFDNIDEIFNWAVEHPKEAIKQSCIFEKFKQETLIKTFTPYWLPYKNPVKQ